MYVFLRQKQDEIMKQLQSWGMRFSYGVLFVGMYILEYFAFILLCRRMKNKNEITRLQGDYHNMYCYDHMQT